jgi:hypothetical protein
MPNCAPTEVVDIMEETARSSYQARLRLPACGRWRDFLVATPKLKDLSAAIISLRETVERMPARNENGTARES